MHSLSNEGIEKIAMKIFVLLYLVSVAFVSFQVSSTTIEISTSPVTLPDPESLINYVSSAIVDVYKSAIIAVSKYCTEVLEPTSELLETAENGISLETRKIFDAIRSNVDAVFENFNNASTALSGIIKEASSLGQEELERAQVVWKELKYGVRRLRRNVGSIRTNMKSSLAEIKNNFVHGSQEFNKAMNDLYTKVLDELCFEVRSSTNMFQHALSLPSLKYFQIDLEDVYRNWVQFLQPVKQTPANLFKSARSFFNLVYNAVQTKFFLGGNLLDNALWHLSSMIIWGDALQVKRFVDKTLRRLGRYIKESLGQIRVKFGKDSAALLEANRSLYNQIQNEIKQLVDLTEIPFKRMFSFYGGLMPFSNPSIPNPPYSGRFKEMLSYLQSKNYPVQLNIAECINLMSFNSDHSQKYNFFDYLPSDTFKKSSPSSEDSLIYTKILQEERIQEVTNIYRGLFDVVQKCAETAHEDGYKLPKIISMKVEDDALKYTLLMNDIRVYVGRSACFIEHHYSHSSEEYMNAVNGLCEDIKHKLDIAADYILNFIQRLHNYLENHQSCLERFPLWTNSERSKTNDIGSAIENIDSYAIKTNVLTSVGETENIEDIGSSDLKKPSSADIEAIQETLSTTMGTDTIVDRNLENEVLYNKNQGILEDKDIISHNMTEENDIDTVDEHSLVEENLCNSNTETGQNMLHLASEKAKYPLRTFKSNRKKLSTDIETLQGTSLTKIETDAVVDGGLDNEILSDKNQGILDHNTIYTHSINSEMSNTMKIDEHSIINTVNENFNLENDKHDSNTETSQNVLDLALSKRTKYPSKTYKSNRKTSSTDMETIQDTSLTNTEISVIVDKNLENDVKSIKNHEILEDKDLISTNSISNDVPSMKKIEENSIIKTVDDSDAIVDKNAPEFSSLGSLSNAIDQASSKITGSKQNVEILENEESINCKIMMEESDISAIRENTLQSCDSNGFNENEENIMESISFTTSKRKRQLDKYATLDSNNIIDEYESDYEDNLGTHSLKSSYIDQEEMKVVNSDFDDYSKEVQFSNMNQEETILSNYQSNMIVEENQLVDALKDIQISANPEELAINNVINKESSALYENVEMESMKNTVVENSKVESTEKVMRSAIDDISDTKENIEEIESKINVDNDNECGNQKIFSNHDSSTIPKSSVSSRKNCLKSAEVNTSSLVNYGGPVLGKIETTSSNSDMNIMENFCADNSVGECRKGADLIKSTIGGTVEENIVKPCNKDKSGSIQSSNTYESMDSGILDKSEVMCVDDFPEKVTEFKEGTTIINREREIELNEMSHSNYARSISFDNGIEATLYTKKSTAIENGLSELSSDTTTTHKDTIGEFGIDALNEMELQRTKYKLDSISESTSMCDNQGHTNNILEKNIMETLNEQNMVRTQKDRPISKESSDNNSNIETFIDSKCDSAKLGLKSETLENSSATNILNENIEHIHNEMSEQMTGTIMNLSKEITKDSLIMNENALNEVMELTENDGTNKLTSEKVTDTHPESIATENCVEHKATFNEESSSSNAFITTITETTENHEKTENKIVESASELSKKIELDNTMESKLVGDKVVESKLDGADQTQPLYDMVWFPKKSWIPSVSPISSLQENDYGWFGWFVPGKQRPISLENPLNLSDKTDDSEAAFTDKKVKVLENETIEKDQSSSFTSSKSETTQSSFTETKTASESVDVQGLEIPDQNRDCIENDKKLVLETTGNSAISNHEESSLFKKWYNSLVKSK